MSTNRCPILDCVNPRLSDRRSTRLVRIAVAALVAACSCTSARGQDTADDLAQALRDGDLELALRYRYEFVDTAAFALHANASLLRTRLSYTSAAFRGLTLGLEVDDLRAIVADEFNDTRNGRIERPVVADPEGTEINRAWVAYRTASGARFGLGRQRLEAPRRRFVASLNWRLNEQTFDALTATHTFGERLTLDYAYAWNVNRIFGPDSGVPAADFAGRVQLLDAHFALDASSTLHGYGYLLDFDDAASQSSATLGLAYSAEHAIGTTLTLPYSIEAALQTDYGANPVGYRAHYLNAQIGLSHARLRIDAGFERLDGDGTPGSAVTTPLAGLNGLNGWTDQFLVIPDVGLDDLSLGLTLPVGPGELRLIGHDFSAASGGADYGTEIDFELGWPFAERYRLLIRAGDYVAAGHSVDTTKLWLMLDARF